MARETDVPFIDSKDPKLLGWPGLQPSTTVADGMVFQRDVAVSLRDGVRVYVDVRRPDTQQPVPVLVAYGPYGKHLGFKEPHASGAGIEPPLPPGTPFEAPNPQYWVGHGYAVVYVDPRGTWGSEGDAYFWSPQEGDDGYDIVEWAGTQPWSNGKVGLSGVSYLAMIQYRIAAARPPHLAAINISDGQSDLYREGVFHGGILETQFARRLQDTVGFGLQRREDIASLIMAHPFLDEWWESRGVDVSRIEVPAYVVCSVANQGLHTRGTLEAYKAMGSKQKWLDVNGRKEWRHYYNPAEMDRQRAFFDHFLKGLDTEVISWFPVRVEYRDRTETGPIRAEQGWPVPSVEYTVFYLDAHHGSLRREQPNRPGQASYDPTAVTAFPMQAHDQRAVFDLCFEEETLLAGSAALRLWVESPGATDMDLFVVLDKIGTDGHVVHYPFCAYLDDGPLAMGWLRASRRELDPERSTPQQPVHAHTRDLPLPPGEPVSVDIEIWPFTAQFHPGEALRLTIAGANIYRWSLDHFVHGHDLLVNTAPHLLYTGGNHAARLLLPLIPSAAGSPALPSRPS
jgi:uncharacterized protein